MSLWGKDDAAEQGVVSDRQMERNDWMLTEKDGLEEELEVDNGLAIGYAKPPL